MITDVKRGEGGAMRRRTWQACLVVGLALSLLGGAGHAATFHSASAARFHYGRSIRPAHPFLPGRHPAGPGGGAQIYAMNADGSNQTNLTNDSRDNEYSLTVGK